MDCISVLAVFFGAIVGLILGLMLGRMAFVIFDIRRINKSQREYEAKQVKIKADIAAYSAKSDEYKAENIRPHTPFIIQTWNGLSQAKQDPMLAFIRNHFDNLRQLDLEDQAKNHDKTS